jgi:hypothetical protein
VYAQLDVWMGGCTDARVDRGMDVSIDRTADR